MRFASTPPTNPWASFAGNWSRTGLKRQTWIHHPAHRVGGTGHASAQCRQRVADGRGVRGALKMAV